jgi:hypothetical protein
MSAVEELPPGIHVVGDDHVKVYDQWIEVPYLIPVWESGQSYTYKRSSRLKDDLQFRECMGFRDKTESVLTHLPGEQYNTDVPVEWRDLLNLPHFCCECFLAPRRNVHER